MTQLVAKLDQYSGTLGVITADLAKRVIDVMNRKIRHAIGGADNSMVRFYWRETGEGGPILSAIAPLVRTTDDKPRPFQVSDGPDGQLSWVYHRNQPLWLEDLGKQRAANKFENFITKERIDPAHVCFARYAPECQLMVPLVVQSEVHGVYAVDVFGAGGVFTEHFFGQLKSIARCLAVMQWHATSLRYNLALTERGTSSFLESIREDPVEREAREFSGFIARPFESAGDLNFDEIEALMVHTLTNVKVNHTEVKARRYVPQNMRYTIEEIHEQVRHSSFGIADLTGNKPSVIHEVGMMMMCYPSDKHVMLLKHADDETDIPFNLQFQTVYRYRVVKRKLEVCSPGGSASWRPFGKLLQEFLDARFGLNT